MCRMNPCAPCLPPLPKLHTCHEDMQACHYKVFLVHAGMSRMRITRPSEQGTSSSQRYKRLPRAGSAPNLAANLDLDLSPPDSSPASVASVSAFAGGALGSSGGPPGGMGGPLGGVGGSSRGAADAAAFMGGAATMHGTHASTAESGMGGDACHASPLDTDCSCTKPPLSLPYLRMFRAPFSPDSAEQMKGVESAQPAQASLQTFVTCELILKVHAASMRRPPMVPAARGADDGRRKLLIDEAKLLVCSRPTSVSLRWLIAVACRHQYLGACAACFGPCSRSRIMPMDALTYIAWQALWCVLCRP